MTAPFVHIDRGVHPTRFVSLSLSFFHGSIYIYPLPPSPPNNQIVLLTNSSSLLFTPTTQKRLSAARIMKAAVLVFLVAVLYAVAAVSAQDMELAPSPAPSMETGSSFGLSISGTILCSSLLVSLLALLKQ
uniref:Uncharacterized protein n=1 Tax=Nelumbo nucifera TaxID=4432 RepID=A0A822ZBP3_NELNU|nr:TPA_asm: hypothetical protein HUJ06_000557 [Nelumbo nucifera]